MAILNREDVAWIPVCTHTSFMERPNGLHDMTEKQLLAYNAGRKKHLKCNVTECVKVFKSF